MAAIEIKVTKDRTPEMLAELDRKLEGFVKGGAAHVAGQLRASMNEPKTGRAYKRGKNRVHIASAPGESPANDTQNLNNSIQQIFPSTLEALIGTAVEYAKYLEDGTRRMAARPLWQKTVDDSMPTLEKMLQEAVATI